MYTIRPQSPCSMMDRCSKAQLADQRRQPFPCSWRAADRRVANIGNALITTIYDLQDTLDNHIPG